MSEPKLNREWVDLDALDVREREVEGKLRLLAEPGASAHVAGAAAQIRLDTS